MVEFLSCYKKNNNKKKREKKMQALDMDSK